MEINFTQMDCLHCNFVYMVPAVFIGQRREDHEFFHCPSCGKTVHYPQDNKEEKLEKQVARLKREVSFESARRDENYSALEHEIRVRTGHQGQIAKLKKKLAECQPS